MGDTWDSPYHNAWTKFMTKVDFCKSALYYTSMTTMTSKAETRIVRPLLNILKKTLGRYAVAGSDRGNDGK